MFRFPPFNTPSFRHFASTSATIITRAEEEARHVLKNLPDNIVASFRGLATDIKMDQEVQRTLTDARWQAMENRMDEITGMIGMIAGTKASKARKGHKCECLFRKKLACTLLTQNLHSGGHLFSHPSATRL
jgi:hypothetical protein